MVEQPSTSPGIQPARYPQFTLRTLLLLTAVCALLLALITYWKLFGAFVVLFIGLVCLSAVLALRGKINDSLATGACALLLLTFLLPHVPATHFLKSQDNICTMCGQTQHSHREGRIGDANVTTSYGTIQQTQASMWFHDHFGECRQHDWKLVSGDHLMFTKVFGLRWGEARQYSHFANSEGLEGRLNEDDKRRLDKLFVQDKEACKEAFSKMLQ